MPRRADGLGTPSFRRASRRRSSVLRRITPRRETYPALRVCACGKEDERDQECTSPRSPRRHLAGRPCCDVPRSSVASPVRSPARSGVDVHFLADFCATLYPFPRPTSSVFTYFTTSQNFARDKRPDTFRIGITSHASRVQRFSADDDPRTTVRNGSERFFHT